MPAFTHQLPFVQLLRRGSGRYHIAVMFQHLYGAPQRGADRLCVLFDNGQERHHKENAFFPLIPALRQRKAKGGEGLARACRHVQTKPFPGKPPALKAFFRNRASRLGQGIRGYLCQMAFQRLQAGVPVRRLLCRSYSAAHKESRVPAVALDDRRQQQSRQCAVGEVVFFSFCFFVFRLPIRKSLTHIANFLYGPLKHLIDLCFR